VVRREKRLTENEERYRADQERKRAKRKRKMGSLPVAPAMTVAMPRQSESTEEGMKHRLPGFK